MAVLVIQWIDVPKFKFEDFIQSDTLAMQVFPPRLWDKLLSGKNELYVTPPFKCGGRTDEITTLQLLAAKNHVLINTVYSARSWADCDEKQADMLSHLEKGTVHVFLSVVYKNPVTVEQVEQWVGVNTRKWCRQFSRGIVCVPEPEEKDEIILNNKIFTKLPKGN